MVQHLPHFTSHPAAVLLVVLSAWRAPVILSYLLIPAAAGLQQGAASGPLIWGQPGHQPCGQAPGQGGRRHYLRHRVPPTSRTGPAWPRVGAASSTLLFYCFGSVQKGQIRSSQSMHMKMKSGSVLMHWTSLAADVYSFIHLVCPRSIGNMGCSILAVSSHSQQSSCSLTTLAPHVTPHSGVSRPGCIVRQRSFSPG